MSLHKGKNNLWPASTGFKIILSAGMKINFGILESILDLVEGKEEEKTEILTSGLSWKIGSPLSFLHK